LLDTAAGLRSFGGVRSSYERMLRRFPALHRVDASQFRDAVDAADPDSARRVVHTLKGVAATLGAQALRAAAAECEEWLAAGATAASAAPVERLMRVLAKTIDAIQAEFPSEAALPQPAPAAMLSDEDAAERMGRLEWLLAHDDMRSGELWQELAPWCAVQFGEQSVAALARAVQDFDFPSATQQLRLLQSRSPPEQVH
jgi:HPt (histidine-containing phosphotransfer) domain-containing protein